MHGNIHDHYTVCSVQMALSLTYSASPLQHVACICGVTFRHEGHLFPNLPSHQGVQSCPERNTTKTRLICNSDCLWEILHQHGYPCLSFQTWVLCKECPLAKSVKLLFFSKENLLASAEHSRSEENSHQSTRYTHICKFFVYMITICHNLGI